MWTGGSFEELFIALQGWLPKDAGLYADKLQGKYKSTAGDHGP